MPQGLRSCRAQGKGERSRLPCCLVALLPCGCWLPWYLGILVPWAVDPCTLESWYRGIYLSCNLGIKVPWYLGTLGRSSWYP